jgi:hypothetical protein
VTRSPIPRVLSTLRRRRVKALLMGGHACILYGAAEFSRDVDLAVAVEVGNLSRLRGALDDLDAEPVYFPALSAEALNRGHACHFLCRAPGLENVRVDIIAVMRGVDPFPSLWRRRERIRLPGIGTVAVMAVRDLVRAKKTQSDKDWPMIRRLVEADIAGAPRRPPASRVRFWLQECRTADLLCDLARRYPRLAAAEAPRRPALRTARHGNRAGTEAALRREEDRERARDRQYWKPLRKELERWRQERFRRSGTVSEL